MHTHPVLLRRSAATLAAGLACLFGAASTQAQTATAPTVITSLPFTISTGGTYVLNSSLNSSQAVGSLITINASNVTLDFQGNYIAGPVGNTNQSTIGVSANEQSNVIVRNGIIAFCAQGIVIGGNGGATTNSVDEQVDNMRVTSCYNVGINVFNSPASRVTNCQVSQIGGANGGNSNAFGILSDSPGSAVRNNTVTNLTGRTSYGILIGATSFARLNTIATATFGVMGGKFQENLTFGTTTPFSGGTNAGGNN